MANSKTWWIVVFVPVLCFPGQAAAGPDAGLVAHYAFEEKQGDGASDGGTGGHDGKIHGAVRVKGAAGRALRFDGKGAFVDCGKGARLGLADGLTVAAWIRPEGKPTGEPLIAGEGPTRWGMTHYKGRVYFYISGGGNYSYVPVSYHQWTHVAGTFDGTTARLYVNGEPRTSKKLPAGTTIKSGGRFLVGTDAARKGHYHGAIDEVRVYGRALSSKEMEILAGMRRGDVQLTPEQREAAVDYFKRHPGTVGTRHHGPQWWLANGDLGIEFVEGGGGVRLSRLYGVESGQDFLHQRATPSPQGLWQLVMRKDKGRDAAEITVTSRAAAATSCRLERQGGTQRREPRSGVFGIPQHNM